MELTAHVALDAAFRRIVAEWQARAITRDEAVRRLVGIGWTPRQAAEWVDWHAR